LEKNRKRCLFARNEFGQATHSSYPLAGGSFPIRSPKNIPQTAVWGNQVSLGIIKTLSFSKERVLIVLYSYTSTVSAGFATAREAAPSKRRADSS
jgi:hypothetical protein